MTAKLETFADILDFAMEQEREAEAFYRDLALLVKATSMRQILEEFAEEERMHLEKLKMVKQGQFHMLDGSAPMPSVHIAAPLPRAKAGPDMDLADALIIAMQREKAAYRLYIGLAADAPNQELMDLFLALAHEEANHKLRFEIEYDEWIIDEA
jgi:rubrerythrin